MKRGEKDAVCVVIKAIKSYNEDEDDAIYFMQDELWNHFYLNSDEQTTTLCIIMTIPQIVSHPTICTTIVIND